jgi:hypothetical protein
VGDIVGLGVAAMLGASVGSGGGGDGSAVRGSGRVGDGVVRSGGGDCVVGDGIFLGGRVGRGGGRDGVDMGRAGSGTVGLVVPGRVGALVGVTTGRNVGRTNTLASVGGEAAAGADGALGCGTGFNVGGDGEMGLRVLPLLLVSLNNGANVNGGDNVVGDIVALLGDSVVEFVTLSGGTRYNDEGLLVGLTAVAAVVVGARVASGLMDVVVTGAMVGAVVILAVPLLVSGNGEFAVEDAEPELLRALLRRPQYRPFPPHNPPTTAALVTMIPKATKALAQSMRCRWVCPLWAGLSSCSFQISGSANGTMTRSSDSTSKLSTLCVSYVAWSDDGRGGASAGAVLIKTTLSSG